MGTWWWPFGSKNEADMSAGSRIQCYDNRDTFFRCLEDNNEDRSKCKALEKQFHKHCMQAWVKYFEMQREKLKAAGKPWESPNMEGQNGVRAPARP
mmetsp:Transcript_45796/g.71760  ORF Transcript_45796/g.71760 Transcript_45796/m.71760 type:complete len:96 (+) Transcript_45796:207-494(+)